MISKLLRPQNFAIVRKNLDSTATAFAECHRKFRGLPSEPPPFSRQCWIKFIIVLHADIRQNSLQQLNLQYRTCYKIFYKLEGLLHFSPPYLSIETSLQLPPAILSPTLAIHPNQAASRGQ